MDIYLTWRGSHQPNPPALCSATDDATAPGAGLGALATSGTSGKLPWQLACTALEFDQSTDQTGPSARGHRARCAFRGVTRLSTCHFGNTNQRTLGTHPLRDTGETSSIVCQRREDTPWNQHSGHPCYNEEPSFGCRLRSNRSRLSPGTHTRLSRWKEYCNSAPSGWSFSLAI